MTVSVPVSAPVEAGLKLTVIVHDALAASVCGEVGQFDVSEKLPVVAMLEMVSGVVVFVRVKLSELEEPIATWPKPLVAGVNVTEELPAPPVPVSKEV